MIPDHAARRRSLILRSTGWNVLARAVAILAGLVQVPIALHYLRDEAFGLWVALSGIVQLMNFADLGLGLGLQNRISEAFGRDSLQEIRNLQATGTRFLGVLGFILAVCMIPLCWVIPWADVLKLEDRLLASEVPPALSCLVAGFAIGLPLNAGVRLAAGVQQTWLQGVWTAGGSVLSLVMVVAAAAAKLPFPAFVAAAAIAPLVTNWGIGFSVSRVLGPGYFQLDGQVLKGLFRPLLRQGLLFLTPQVSSTVLLAAPGVMIASVLGPAAVTPFSLCQRLSAVLLQFQGMPLLALWPAYAEAHSRGDSGWIRITFRKSMVYGLLSGIVIGLGLFLTGGWVILHWTQKPDVVPSISLLAGFALWTACVAFVTPLAVLLNGTNRLRGQAIGGACAAIVAVLVIPTAAVHFGVSGVIYAILGAWLLFGVTVTLRDFFRPLRSADGTPQKS